MARHWQPQSRTCQPKNHPQEYRITNNRNNLHEHIYTKDAFTGHFIRTTNRHSIRGSVRAIVPAEALLSLSVLCSFHSSAPFFGAKVKFSNPSCFPPWSVGAGAWESTTFSFKNISSKLEVSSRPFTLGLYGASISLL